MEIQKINDNSMYISKGFVLPYDEMILVLSEPNTISDLLVYSLGLRDTTELTKIGDSMW